MGVVGDHSLFAEGAVRPGLVPIYGDATHADFGVVPRGAAVSEEDGAALFRRRLRHNGGGACHSEGDHAEHPGSAVQCAVGAAARSHTSPTTTARHGHERSSPRLTRESIESTSNVWPVWPVASESSYMNRAPEFIETN